MKYNAIVILLCTLTLLGCKHNKSSLFHDPVHEQLKQGLNISVDLIGSTYYFSEAEVYAAFKDGEFEFSTIQSNDSLRSLSFEEISPTSPVICYMDKDLNWTALGNCNPIAINNNWHALYIAIDKDWNDAPQRSLIKIQFSELPNVNYLYFQLNSDGTIVELYPNSGIEYESLESSELFNKVASSFHKSGETALFFLRGDSSLTLENYLVGMNILGSYSSHKNVLLPMHDGSGAPQSKLMER